MKSPFRQLFLGNALALSFAFSLAALAQEPAKPEEVTPPASPPAAPAATAPSAPIAPATPPVEAPAAGPNATPAPTPAAPDAANAAPGEPALRRLDQPSSSDETRTETRTEIRTSRRHRGSSNDFPFGDHTVSQGNIASEIVSILGSTVVDGEVDYAAVSIAGSTTVGPEGRVGGEAVAVFGPLVVKGRVRQEAVSVLGGVYVDGHVGGEVVSVLGDLELGPNAIVDGDIVVVAGEFKADPKAIVRGNRVSVPFLGQWSGVNGLVTWFKHCLILGRPLAFVSGIGFAWALAIGFLVLYVLIALVFRGGVEKCLTTLETRPGSSILTSVLASLLTPVVIVLLCLTVIGIVAVPFFALGMIVAGLFGKAVMLAWVGRRITKFFGDGPLNHAAFAVLVGGLIVMLIYCVPFLGMLVKKTFDLLGFGVVVYTLMLANRREKATPPPRQPGAPAPAPAPAPIPPSAPVPASTSSLRLAPLAPTVPLAAVVSPSMSAPPPAMPMSSPGFGSMGAVAGEPAAEAAAAAAAPVEPTPMAAPAPTYVPPPMPPPVAPMPPISAATNQRAGFMIRLWALLLDIVLVAIVTIFVFHSGPVFPVLVAAYAAVMWKFKGTTVGGVICGLKVVRIDGRDLDWTTAIVRALGCFLSLAVVGLGFLWVAIDDDKQSWHDKIAGTTVVSVPKGVSLI